jgi:hypothetical protein
MFTHKYSTQVQQYSDSPRPPSPWEIGNYLGQQESLKYHRNLNHLTLILHCPHTLPPLNAQGDAYGPIHRPLSFLPIFCPKPIGASKGCS